MNRTALFASLLGFSVSLAGCALAPEPAPVVREEFLVGGPCRYIHSAGLARVLRVTPEAGNVRVEFALSLPSGFRAPSGFHGEHLAVVLAGPPGARDDHWFAGAGLVAGASFPVQVSFITEGTCTPVLYRFPGRPWTVL